MGEIADMMLDGTMCQGCGEFLHDGEDGPGYPGWCSSCRPPGTSQRPAVHKPAPQHRCRICNKRLRSPEGVETHMRDKHGIPGGDRQRIRPDVNKTEFP